MSNSTTQSSRTLGYHLHVAKVPGDGQPEWGPSPGMSRRAKLIARMLVVTALAIAAVAVDPSLLVVVAFALPFWIATEFEAPAALSSAPARSDLRSSLELIKPWCCGDSTPKAA